MKRSRYKYEIELRRLNVELTEAQKKFGDYQRGISATVNADVRDNYNTIDSRIKQKAQIYKITDDELKESQMKQLQSSKLMSTQGSFLKSQTSTTINIQNMNIQTAGADLEVVKEFHRLRENEKEAREEIIQLNLMIRKIRIMQKMKEVTQKETTERKIKTLQNQQSSNQDLWD